MEETAKKEKKQAEVKEEKDKQPAGKEKKEEQELVREKEINALDTQTLNPPESLQARSSHTFIHNIHYYKTF